ncbi:glycosyltransferase [Pseudoalteromonas sp. P1-8]|uniref:glycosyltransferase n=1 Tax=Pseudoalteromonas sp. P1-8 TaxID=1710353 RepID=UPI0006DCD8C3|nr:glycosyltransferase [Pseudoalteromonas sp. P1-8]KPV96914.1 GDP-mannose-dependent alpha-(1-6)-phosphatidylinositol monomannoside mannosyltransferase [Pseudoalteromonas sp. P1-8]
MNKVKLAIVVEKFPVLSQSFINRLVEELAKNTSLAVTIVTIYNVDFIKLKKQAPNLYSLYSSGQISILSSNSISKISRGMQLISSIVSYIPLLLLSKEFKNRSIFDFSLKLHAKAALMTRLMKNHEFDVMHGQFMDLTAYLVLAKTVNPNISKKLFSTGRGVDISKYGIVTEKEVDLFENSNAGVEKYFFVSESLKRIAVNKGVSESKCFVNYSGLDFNTLPEYNPPSNKSTDSIKLIQVGRLVEKKGILMSLSAILKLKDRYNIKLEVFGEGPLIGEAKRFVNKNKLEDCVHFFGATHNSKCMSSISKSDIILVPSRTGADGNSEGIPNVAKEAMALGCIVVASDHSGLPELIEHEKTGYLFEEGNLESYINTLELAISQRHDWDNITRNAEFYVTENFSIKLLAQELVGHYVGDI